VKAPADVTLTKAQQVELGRCLGTERMIPYGSTTSTPTEAVLDLYAYNMRLASGVLGVLHVLEVVTRNAMHEALSANFGREDWWSTPGLQLVDWSRDKFTKTVDKTIGQARSASRPHVAGDVVAALDFGVWVGLLDGGGRCDYERTLWQPALQSAFPYNRRDRNGTWRAFNNARRLRNRVMHHEPIHDRFSLGEYDELIRLIGFVSPPVADWIRNRSLVPLILKAKALSTRTTHF
jgi:hypothetical protein